MTENLILILTLIRLGLRFTTEHSAPVTGNRALLNFLTAGMYDGLYFSLLTVFGTVTVNGKDFGYGDFKLPVFPARDGSHVVTLRFPVVMPMLYFFADKPLE